jgi:membrane-associated phospholipid phosphatase
MFKSFIRKLPENVAASFKNNNWVWHLVMIGLTYLLVVSDFDWWYFESTRSVIIRDIALPAAPIGFLLPISIPFIIYFIGKKEGDRRMMNAASATAQAGMIAALLTAVYKAFTGRLQPQLVAHPPITVDISNAFNFGFLKHGIFWGWPSSHTAVAFAMAITLALLYRNKKALVYSLVIYALYIGLAVSVTIHWFSDFVAGAILGTVVAFVVAKSFHERNE